MRMHRNVRDNSIRKPSIKKKLNQYQFSVHISGRENQGTVEAYIKWEEQNITKLCCVGCFWISALCRVHFETTVQPGVKSPKRKVHLFSGNIKDEVACTEVYWCIFLSLLVLYEYPIFENSHLFMVWIFKQHRLELRIIIVPYSISFQLDSFPQFSNWFLNGSCYST